MSPAKVELYAVGAAVLVGGLLLWKFAGAAKGALTGDNELTRNATNAQGERVTAYQGAGIVGTVGAAANAASGGVLASIGEWIGGKVFDVTHPDPEATAMPSAAIDEGGIDAGWTYLGGA